MAASWIASNAQLSKSHVSTICNLLVTILLAFASIRFGYILLRSATFSFVILPVGIGLNPRPAGGGGDVWTPPPPSGFSRIAKNGGAQRRRVFTHLTPHLFHSFCEYFDPMPCDVRSLGQVKWPNYKITFQSRHGYNVSGKVMKLSEYDELISAYKTYISDFWYRWPQVRSFLRPTHYKSMGKKSTPLYLLWRKHVWVESYRIGQLWTIRVKICIAYP